MTRVAIHWQCREAGGEMLNRVNHRSHRIVTRFFKGWREISIAVVAPSHENVYGNSIAGSAIASAIRLLNLLVQLLDPSRFVRLISVNRQKCDDTSIHAWYN